MQELADHIYIETAYTGVTLGAINWPHGLVLIDAPFRIEDARSWRSALLNLGGGVDRILINLDSHYDRTLGVRAMDCTIVGHEKIAEAFRNRPITFKTTGAETGGEWELHNNLGSIRWVPPEITFTEKLMIHWNESPLILEHHPGPSIGAIWAVLPDQHVAFVGDALAPDQPPFLADADLPRWIESLRPLTQAEYQNFLLVSGRSGLVAHQQVRQQIQQLEKIHHQLEKLAAQKAPAIETRQLVPTLLAEFEIPPEREILFRQRLIYGLSQYYSRHYHPPQDEILD